MVGMWKVDDCLSQLQLFQCQHAIFQEVEIVTELDSTKPKCFVICVNQ